MSVRLTVSEVRPIFMIRLVADRAGIMNGGLAHVGSVAVIWESRSATSWRARSSSVSREKNSWIEDSWATDFDRRSSRPSIPFSWFSIGTVISSSTSLEEFPRAMVWISTRGGANSGNTSTLVSGIWTKPIARVATARNSTIHRNLRLVATMRFIRVRPSVAGIIVRPSGAGIGVRPLVAGISAYLPFPARYRRPRWRPGSRPWCPAAGRPTA